MLISQHEDKSFKILIDFTMHDFLKGIGIDEEIIVPLPTELMATNCMNRRLDYCGLSRNYEIINVEFQSTVLSEEDEIRIFDYASSLFVKFKLPVKTFIISTVEDKSRKIEKWHHNDVFTIYIISLKDRDGLKALNSIKSKIRNKFMKSDFNEKELLFEVGDLTNKARFESDFVKDQVKSILLILGNKFIKDKEELKNFGDIMMESSHLLSFVKRTSGDLIEEGRKEGKSIGIGEGVEGKSIGIGEGVEIGRKDGIISVAKRMLMKGMDIDVISDATGLSIEEINSLKEK